MPVWTVPAVILAWTDADTCRCALDLGFAITYTAAVRVIGVNAAERGTPDGQAATGWAQQVAPTGTQITVTSHQWDKYGRVLGSITLPDGTDYGQQVVAAGHAQPYNGTGPR